MSATVRDRADDRPTRSFKSPATPTQFVTVTYWRSPGRGSWWAADYGAGRSGSLMISPNTRVMI